MSCCRLTSRSLRPGARRRKREKNGVGDLHPIGEVIISLSLSIIRSPFSLPLASPPTSLLGSLLLSTAPLLHAFAPASDECRCPSLLNSACTFLMMGLHYGKCIGSCSLAFSGLRFRSDDIRANHCFVIQDFCVHTIRVPDPVLSCPTSCRRPSPSTAPLSSSLVFLSPPSPVSTSPPHSSTFRPLLFAHLLPAPFLSFPLFPSPVLSSPSASNSQCLCDVKQKGRDERVKNEVRYGRTKRTLFISRDT